MRWHDIRVSSPFFEYKNKVSSFNYVFFSAASCGREIILDLHIELAFQVILMNACMEFLLESHLENVASKF